MLILLFLVIASTSYAISNLALAPGESERTQAVEFDSVPKYVRANSTVERKDEERGVRTILTNREILARFETLFSQLSHFSLESIKKFAWQHIDKVPREKRRQVFYSLLDPTFLAQLRRANSFRFEKYVDIALYLVLLESVDGSLRVAAKQIHDAIILAEKFQNLEPTKKADLMKKKEKGLVKKKVEDILFDEDAVEILHKMEAGQFLLWNEKVGDLSKVQSWILEKRNPSYWKDIVEGRYIRFRADMKKRQIPGIQTGRSSTSDFRQKGPGQRMFYTAES